MLTLQHLYIIEKITSEGSVTKAAEKLNLTQSALSHQIRDLEAASGVKLFNRIGKKLVLNEAGQRVVVDQHDVWVELADGLFDRPAHRPRERHHDFLDEELERAGEVETAVVHPRLHRFQDHVVVGLIDYAALRQKMSEGAVDDPGDLMASLGKLPRDRHQRVDVRDERRRHEEKPAH